MAGGSLIGSLRVALGLDSAQFTTGLAKARGEVSGFSNAAKIGFAAVGAAAIAAGAALGVAVKRSLDHADALGKAAQKAGVSVEALSRLEYAARLSDVSMEGLTGSLTKLGKAMVDATVDKGGQASIAFKALGIDVRDASGNIRDTNAVFLDIADRFGRMEDGATKSTLAMQLFGKAGAELIPLLNSGRDGLKGMADESDRVGFTLSKQTGAAAEAFNDTLTRVGLGFEGVANTVTRNALPALQDFANVLADPGLQQAVADVANLIIQSMTAAGQVISGVAKAARDMWAALSGPAGAGGAGAGPDDIRKQIADWQKVLEWNTKNSAFGDQSIGAQRAANEIAALQKELAAKMAGGTTFGGSAWVGGWGAEGVAPKTSDKPTTQTFSPTDIAALGDAAKSANQFIDPFQARMQELAPVLDDLHNPMSTMKDDLTDLETMFKSGRITAEVYGQAVQRTYANVAASALDMASGITGALASMFKDNKAFAVANAVVQTLSGVANAIGSGPPPWNFINAGIAAASGAANVANILSTSETSTSVPGTSAATASSTAAAAAPRQAVNISLQGGQFFSRGQVEQLLDSLADAMGDGAGGRLINVITG